MQDTISTRQQSPQINSRGKGRSNWFVAILGVVALVVGTNYVLLGTATEPTSTFSIDLEALHRAAIADGALPDRIEVEKVAEWSFPRSLVVAGDGFAKHAMSASAYRLVWPDRSVVIDTALGPEAAKRLPFGKFDIAAYGRLQKALTQAEAIVFTHEHYDHVGGVAAAPAFAAIASKVRITHAQLVGPNVERGLFSPSVLQALQPFDYQGLYAIAPGVVLQKAPGHAAGTQLIYVELSSGVRYLFVGDIAWSEDNITLQTGRPRLATLLFQEDRPAVAAQVRAFAALPKDVHVVVAHDPVALARDVAAGLLHQGFTD